MLDDKKVHDIFRKNHPIRTHNDKGELRWEGSLAEYYLKEDMAKDLHIGVKPEDFRQTREEYLLFSKNVFRGHIHQEKKLKKLYNYLEARATEKKEQTAKKAAANRAAKEKEKTAAKKKSEDSSSDSSGSDSSESSSSSSED